MSVLLRNSAFVVLLTAVSGTGQTVVLRNFTLIDGTGKAPVPNAALVITDGRIRYAGPASVAKAPSGATNIDLKGKYVMPGIINLHGHVGNVIDLVQDPKNFTRANTEHNLRTYASYGVTSVISMGSRSGPRFSDSLRAARGHTALHAALHRRKGFHRERGLSDISAPA